MCIRFQVAVILLVLTPLFCRAEASLEEPLFIPEKHSRYQWWGDIDVFLNAQSRRALHTADLVLQKHPPRVSNVLERRLALTMIDGVLHEELAPRRTAVQEFLNLRISRATNHLERTSVKQGAMIWKLYNESFIVRTPSVTIAFDLVRGHLSRHAGFGIEDSLAQRIVDQCDVLFVSHRHRDHADDWIVQRFLDAGKPVVAPPEVWRTDAIHEQITHLERVPHEKQTISVQNGRKTLDVVIYPGHQGADVENNVPLVWTPEGITFAHTGDQSYLADFHWIDQVGQQYQVDILMPNCWTPNMPRMVKGFAPRLVLPGHENEMNHTIDHREPHWLTFDRLRDITSPSIVMAWGEHYHYLPE